MRWRKHWSLWDIPPIPPRIPAACIPRNTGSLPPPCRGEAPESKSIPISLARILVLAPSAQILRQGPHVLAGRLVPRQVVSVDQVAQHARHYGLGVGRRAHQAGEFGSVLELQLCQSLRLQYPAAVEAIDNDFSAALGRAGQKMLRHVASRYVHVQPAPDQHEHAGQADGNPLALFDHLDQVAVGRIVIIVFRAFESFGLEEESSQGAGRYGFPRFPELPGKAVEQWAQGGMPGYLIRRCFHGEAVAGE